MRALYVSTLALFIAVFGVIYLFRFASTGATVEPQVLAATSSPQDPRVVMFINEVNQVRSGVGVGEFTYNTELEELAEFRASDMAKRDYYSHNTPEGFTYANYLPEYYPDSTYSCENLQLQVGEDISAAVKAWVNSPPHYRCLTNPRVSKVAISYTSHGEPTVNSSNQSQQMYVFALIASN